MDTDSSYQQQESLFKSQFSKDDFKALFAHEENPKGKKDLKAEFKRIASEAKDKKSLRFTEILDFYFEGEGERIKKEMKKSSTDKVLSSLEGGKDELNERILKVMVLNELQQKLSLELQRVEAEKTATLEAL